MGCFDDSTDGALLRTDSPEAFAAFYRRHLPWILRWLVGHLRDRELAADLTGEVFASALRARWSFDPARASAAPWLQTIARNLLVDSARRGRVEDRARRALGIASLPLNVEDLSHVDALIDQARGVTPATAALDSLPAEQSAAVRARVLEEQDYAEIASRLECSQAVVRQRVSRGLRTMRTTLEEDTT